MQRKTWIVGCALSLLGAGWGAAQDVAVETRTDASGREVYHASDVIGMEVYDESKDQIGKVEDLVIDAQTGEVLYTVISFSGIEEIGDKWVVLPWTVVEPHTDYIMIGVPVDTIVEAPAFTRTEFRQMNFTQVRTRVDKFFADVDVNVRGDRRDRDRDGDRVRTGRRSDRDDATVRDGNRRDRDDRTTRNRRDTETREGRATERDRDADRNDRRSNDRNEADTDHGERGTVVPRETPRSENRKGTRPNVGNRPDAGSREGSAGNRESNRSAEPRTPHGSNRPGANRGSSERGNAPAPRPTTPQSPTAPGPGNQ